MILLILSGLFVAIGAGAARAQSVACASGLFCPVGYVCLQGNKCGQAAPELDQRCDRPGYKKIGTGCFPSGYKDCSGVACKPSERCSGSGKIESACSFYWGQACPTAVQGKCPINQACNTGAKPSGTACYDPAVSYVCPDRNLVCDKGRECIEKPTLDTTCVFVQGDVIPQLARAAEPPRRTEPSRGGTGMLEPEPRERSTGAERPAPSGRPSDGLFGK